MPEVLRAELFGREPSVNLFPGRAGSIRLMKWTPGEFSAERFSKAVAGCSAVVGTGGASRVRICIQTRKSGRSSGPVAMLAAFSDGAESLWFSHCACRCGSPVQSISHHPSVSTLRFVNREHCKLLLHFNSSSAVMIIFIVCLSIETFIFLKYKIIGYGIINRGNSIILNTTYIFIARSFSSTITKVSYFMHIK